MARKILLADDSVTAQNMGRKILTDAGYEVITVNNGSSALKKITEAKPDLIVLDVYMPGYSGLEVCQRIKEAQDTAQIPVLLTVGKLEPFKQEEARRARADAFIIKPFEATELLAAVGKLQDKLGAIPPPSPQKEGRFATATMASFERVMTESAPKFGDQDSGWKNRLKIPAPGAKGPEPEEEPPVPTRASTFRDVAEPPPSSTKVAGGFPDRPIPTGIPQDITPDEIAAITAAAARVNVGMNVGKDFERYRQESPRPELVVPAKDESSKQKEKQEPVSQAPAHAPDPKIGTAAKEIALVETPEAVSAPAAAAVGLASEVVSTQPQAAEEPPHQQEGKLPEPAMVAVAAVAEPATMAVAGRWIAEEVPVEASEAVLVLEREMHKAFAAFAAAEYAALPGDERGAVDKDDEPIFATMAPPAIGSPVPILEEPVATAESEQSESAASPLSAMPGAPVPPVVMRPPAAPFAPAAAMKVDEEQHAVAAFGGPDPFGRLDSKKDQAEEAKVDLERSATSSAADAKVAPQTEFSVTAETNTAPEPIAKAAEAAMADAVRQLESSQEASDEKKPEAAMAAAASADGSSASAEANLSSLVDSMLAELKPKLMAELAKKLEQKK